MRVVVISPPAPIVSPTDFGAAPTDPALLGLISAATEEIDGPSGWLQRSLGQQTLEMQIDDFSRGGTVVIPLPCRPVIEIVSIKFVDGDGIERTVPPASYGRLGDHAVYPKPGYSWPSSLCEPGSVRIRYRAGYTGSHDDDGTGPVPERAKQAIILAVRDMQSLSAENLFLRSEEVEGIGSRTYTVSDAASKIIRTTAERLLSTLRVYT